MKVEVDTRYCMSEINVDGGGKVTISKQNQAFPVVLDEVGEVIKLIDVHPSEEDFSVAIEQRNKNGWIFMIKREGDGLALIKHRTIKGTTRKMYLNKSGKWRRHPPGFKIPDNAFLYKLFEKRISRRRKNKL